MLPTIISAAYPWLLASGWGVIGNPILAISSTKGLARSGSGPANCNPYASTQGLRQKPKPGFIQPKASSIWAQKFCASPSFWTVVRTTCKSCVAPKACKSATCASVKVRHETSRSILAARSFALAALVFAIASSELLSISTTAWATNSPPNPMTRIAKPTLLIRDLRIPLEETSVSKAANPRSRTNFTSFSINSYSSSTTPIITSALVSQTSTSQNVKIQSLRQIAFAQLWGGILFLLVGAGYPIICLVVAEFDFRRRGKR